MFYFFYGEDTYSLKNKVSEFKKRFALSDPSLMNLEEVDGAKLNFEKYSGIVSSLPFLAPKRLVIIKNLLLENKDDIFKKKVAENLSKIPESSVVVFVEQGAPDMRTSLFKALNKPKLALKFGGVTDLTLNSWIENKVKDEGVQISGEGKKRLQFFVGTNLWRMENEIKKLCLFVKAEGRDNILPEDVEKMVKADSNSNIFELIDAVAAGNSKKVFLALQEMKNAGEDEFYIFTMIVYQFRNLFSIFELGSKGMGNQEIAKTAKLHPFVVSKSRNLIRRYTRQKLKDIYLKLYDIDRKIKSGAIDQTLALDLLTVSICRAGV